MSLIFKQIPRSELINGRYYLGRGRNGNIGKWDVKTQCFLLVSDFFDSHTVKYEGYFELEGRGCFQPFKLIDEGKLEGHLPQERGGRYGESLIINTD